MYNLGDAWRIMYGHENHCSLPGIQQASNPEHRVGLVSGGGTRHAALCVPARAHARMDEAFIPRYLIPSRHDRNSM